MAACEDAWLNSGQPAMEVGFGDRNVDPPRETGVKTALSVVVVRARANEPYLEVSAGNQAGEYYGDSGGPLFVAAPDGTWRVAGIDSGSPAFVPGSTAPRFSYYASIPTLIDWAEAATGIDLTPCHELGHWQPGAACKALPAEETSAAESDGWASACRRRPFSVPSPTCEGEARASLRASGGCAATRAPGSPGSSVWMGFVLLLLYCARRSP